MGFAVYHVDKGKGSGGGLGNHIDRVKGKEYSYQNADSERLHLNQVFQVDQGREKTPLHKAVKDRIEKGYNGNRKIRTDAVTSLKHILSGSHKDMTEIFKDRALATEWLKANRDFIHREYGAKNVVRFNLHLDEKTPHLHVITVPLTEDGRLSAKEVIGNKKEMQLRQDRYAEAMQEFGLKRGIRNTGIKHENSADYNKRVVEAQLNSSQSVLEPVKGVLGINKDKTIQKYQSALKSSNLALRESQMKLEQSEVKVNSTNIVRERNDNLIETNRGLKSHVLALKKSNVEDIKKVNAAALKIILSPEETQRIRDEYKKGLEENQSRSRGRGR